MAGGRPHGDVETAIIGEVTMVEMEVVQEVRALRRLGWSVKRENLVHPGSDRSRLPAPRVGGNVERPVLDGDVAQPGVADWVGFLTRLDGEQVAAVADAEVRQSECMQELGD